MISAESQTCTASFNYTQGTNGTIFFNSTSTPQFSLGTSITWTLPGASPSFTTGFNISATYSANGIYTVYIANSTPTVGCSAVQAYTINVTSIVCLVSSHFTIFSQGPNGQVNFANLSSGATSFTWNFGDGNASNTISPSNTYSANGLYTVSLNASNGICDSTYSTIIQVSSYTCSADFVYTVTPAGVAIFSAMPVPLHASNLYDWNFGNAATYTAMGTQTAQTSYSNAGTFNVLHELRTPTNCYDSVSKLVTPCFLDASFSYTHGSSGIVTFSNTTLSSPGTVSYTWSFGDGNFSTAAGPSHQFTANANYTVTLQAQHGLCQSDTSIVINVTSYVPCVINSSFTHTVGIAGLVNFRNTTVHTSSVETTWNFGDGQTGKGHIESHQYQNGGTHYVLMTARDAGNPGCYDSTLQAINITGIACRALANFSIVPGPVPGTWHLVPAYPWNISNAAWSWGDGSTSNTMLASHVYPGTGTFSICLTVTASCGESAKYCSAITFTNAQLAPFQVFVTHPAVSGIAGNGASVIDFELYPVPAGDVLHIHLPQQHDVVSGSVFDSRGRLILLISGHKVSPEYSLDVSNLPSGIYLLRLSDSKTAGQRRFIIAR